MNEHSKWASFVKAHRLSKNMNQGEFAQVMAVSQQTVSRWESGAQIPDAAIQEKLRQQLRVTALNSIAFWKHRVSIAKSFDLLISREATVLAVSQRAASLLAQDGRQILDMRLSDILPPQELQAPNSHSISSTDQFREIGFFDGLIRSIRLTAEWHMPQGSCTCMTDVWPVLTSEQTILGHLTGTPSPIPADSKGWRGIRVLAVDIRLNKDG